VIVTNLTSHLEVMVDVLVEVFDSPISGALRIQIFERALSRIRQVAIMLSRPDEGWEACDRLAVQITLIVHLILQTVAENLSRRK